MIARYLSLLSEIGLEEQEGRVYLALLELGEASISDLAIRSGVKRTSIYNFIGHMIELGIVGVGMKGKKKSYQAMPPERLVQLQEARLEGFKNRIHELSVFMESHAEKPKITHHVGSEQVRQVLSEIYSVKKEVHAIWPHSIFSSDSPSAKQFMADLHEYRVKNKKRLRIIRVPDAELEFDGVQKHRADYRDLRIALPKTPVRMGIVLFDTGTVSFVAPEKDGFAFTVKSQDLYLAMRHLFEVYWDSLGDGQGND